MGTTLLLLLPAVFAAATFTLAAMVFVTRRRRRTQTSATLSSITELQLPIDTFSRSTSVPAGAATGGGPTGEPLEVRSLRAHVRTLESALEQEQHRAAERQDASTAEELVAYRRRVDATIRAMSRQAEGDEAQRILARVSAALERLAAPEGFARPTLSPAGPAGPVAVVGRPTGNRQLHSVGVAPQSAPGTAPETAQLPQQTPTPAVDETSEMAASIIEAVPSPAEPEVVLPVPVMAQSEESRRGRRRFRTRAA